MTAKWGEKLLGRWVRFLDGDQDISKLTDVEKAEYQAKIDAEDSKSFAAMGQVLETVFKVGKLLGVVGIIGIMLTDPSGIFNLLPFFVAIWGIQLLTKK